VVLPNATRSPRIEPSAVLDALGFRDVSPPEPVRGGWDTLLWRFATPDGGQHSLRVYDLARLRPIAWRERVALECCAAAGLPGPRVEAAAEFDGLPAMVLSWCPGQTLLSFAERRPWAIWRLGRLFGATQARIHRVTPPAELAAGAPDEWIARLDARYSGLAGDVRALRPSTASLIHMDFHPLNVISDGSAVTGIIDWSGAAAGDPRADLARTAITLAAAPVPPGPLAPLLNLARRLMLSAWRSGYREEAGALPDYRPFMAWAGATLLAEIELVVDRAEVWGTPDDVRRLAGLIDAWAGGAKARA
jgi:aminoglycoside phosphotransferase (APT) family kinase protein